MGRDDMAVSAKVPSFLYKYTSMEYIEDAIRYGVYASRLGDLNDPYEYNGIVYIEDYRVCCMTTSSAKMLMWAYYGYHRGCCIKYDVSGIISDYPGLIRKVDYTDILRTSHREMNSKELYDNLYRKSKEWKQENEYRAVKHLDKNEDAWNLYENKVFLKAKVKQIIFGVEVSSEPEKYFDALKTIHDYNLKDCNIEVKKMYVKPDKYELKFDPQYDYLRELSK